jgi:hypothetical protein
VKRKHSRKVLLLIATSALLVASLVFAFAQIRRNQPEQTRPRRVEIQGAKVIEVPAGADLQVALDQARCGETIMLSAGANYRRSTSFMLPYKGKCTGTDADYITITTSGAAGLPAAGSRLDPAASKDALARLTSTSDQSILIAAALAHHYKFIGIEFTSDGSKFIHSLISLGADTTYAEREQTSNFVFDRCFVHPPEISATNLASPSKYRQVERGIQANVKEFWLINSYVAGFTGYDAQNGILASMGVFMDSGPGPFHVVNNYIEAWYSNVFLGGSDAPGIPEHTATVGPGATIGQATLSSVEGLNVGDLIAFELAERPNGVARVTVISGKTVSFTPETARDQKFQSAPVSPGRAQWRGEVLHDVEIRRNTLHKRPEWDSYSQPKNWIEFKAGRHIVVEGNLMTSGTPTNITITVRNQNGSSPWIEIRDLVFRYNKLVNFKDPGFGIQLKDNEKVTGDSGGLLIEHNLMIGSTAADSRFFLTHGGFNVTFQHNTVLNRGSLAVGDTLPTTNLVVKDNIMRNGEYGTICYVGNGKMESCWPALKMTGNVIVDNRVTQKNNGPLQNSYPPGNIFVDTDSQIGFIDLANGDLRLDSRSKLKGRSGNGSDPGVDMGALMAAIGGPEKAAGKGQ